MARLYRAGRHHTVTNCAILVAKLPYLVVCDGFHVSLKNHVIDSKYVSFRMSASGNEEISEPGGLGSDSELNGGIFFGEGAALAEYSLAVRFARYAR